MSETPTPPAAEAAPPAPAPPPARVKLSGRRRTAIWSLIVLASVFLLVGILTTWVNRQLLDNKNFSNASAQLLQDPTLRNTLSVYVVNQLYNNVDVAGQLEKQLPNNVKPLAGPVAAGLRQPAVQGVDFLLTQPRFQQAFVKATTVAHQKVVNVLENKTGLGITTGNGVVTVDLGVLVKELGTELGLPAAALDKIPPDTGVFTVMKSDQLGAAQTGVRAIKALSVWLLVLVLILYGLAIYLAHGRRRETLRAISWAFVLVGLIVLVVHRVVGNYAIDSLTSPAYSGAARSVWLIESTILAEIGRAMILYGLIGWLGAVLAGPTAAATSVRRWMAPMLTHRPAVCWGILGGVFLLLLLWAPTHALRTWWGVLLLAGLIALGFEALRRQTMREFPDAAFTGGATAAARSLGTRAAAHTSGNAAGNGSAADQLSRLHDLHESGALTDEEYAQAKQLALNS